MASTSFDHKGFLYELSELPDRISVSAELINAARDGIGTRSHCPVAVALAFALPNARYISVDRDTIRFTDMPTHNRFVFATPKSVQRLIDDFDLGKEHKSVNFRLTEPVSVKPKYERSPTSLLNATRVSNNTTSPRKPTRNANSYSRRDVYKVPE